MVSKVTCYQVKNSKDFQQIREDGQFFKGKMFYVSFRETKNGYSRLGWTLSRNVGSAVLRNKMKRWCRSYLRKREVLLEKSSKDFNIIFLRKRDEFYKKARFKQFEQELDRFLQRFNLPV